jgi:hypothetical protein
MAIPPGGKSEIDSVEPHVPCMPCAEVLYRRLALPATHIWNALRVTVLSAPFQADQPPVRNQD